MTCTQQSEFLPPGKVLALMSVECAMNSGPWRVSRMKCEEQKLVFVRGRILDTVQVRRKIMFNFINNLVVAILSIFGFGQKKELSPELKEKIRTAAAAKTLSEMWERTNRDVAYWESEVRMLLRHSETLLLAGDQEAAARAVDRAREANEQLAAARRKQAFCYEKSLELK